MHVTGLVIWPGLKPLPGLRPGPGPDPKAYAWLKLKPGCCGPGGGPALVSGIRPWA